MVLNGQTMYFHHSYYIIKTKENIDSGSIRFKESLVKTKKVSF